MIVNVKKVSIFFLLFLVFVFKANAQTVDIELLNLSVSPNPIIANQPYTISFDIRNNGPNNGELIVIQIAKDTFLAEDSSIILSSNLTSFTPGWIQEQAKGAGQLKFSQDFTIPPIPQRIPNGTTESFQVTLLAGSAAVPTENINVDVIDFNVFDSNTNNSNQTIPASVVLPPAPDLTFVGGGTLSNFPIDENDLTTKKATFQLVNKD